MAASSLNHRIRDEITKPTPRVVVYLRVSSKRQTDTDADIDPDGNSIDTQRKTCHAKVRELGGVIVEEYLEPAKSGQTLEKRPVFREMMRRIREDRDVDCVVIYLRSRAFRNYVDAGNTEVTLGKLGVKLVSASPKEQFGEGNMAEAMKAIMDVFNWLQVKQSGDDIKIKMGNKARNGGTIGQAKLGYLNTTVAIDGHKVNTVVPDPDRRHFIPMTFELWATGDYPNVESLRAELTKSGLRMPRSGKPISEQRLYDLLRERYYLGYVEYDGIEYQGRHEALVTEEQFERAQRVFDTHGGTGTRQRTHNHYLKGTVWCGRCKYRLIVQRAVGRGGGEYYYFYCRGRQEGLCDLPAIPVEITEEAVLAYYGDAVTMSDEWLTHVRAEVDQAVDTNHELSDTLREQHTKQLEELERKEDYFLDLAAEQGWPKDKLRTKIDAIRSTRREIEDTLARSAQRLDRGREVFRAALALLANPQQAYERGNETVRAILNKAFFTKLYVDGGKVIDHDAQEPFDKLGESYRTYQLNRGTRNPRHLPACTHNAKESKAGPPNPVHVVQGWSKPAVVDLFEALSNPSWPVKRLLGMADRWAKEPLHEASVVDRPKFRPKQQPSLAERLGERGVACLIRDYRSGTTAQELADRHRCCYATIRRLLRAYDVRLK
ncbi:MAG: recombinase family protein [Actinomycetota bacterium]|nr:recombinase family protein [Actinomycetota bacterium]